VQMSAKEAFWIRVFKCLGCIAGWDHKPDCPKGRRAAQIACDSGAVEHKIFQRLAAVSEQIPESTGPARGRWPRVFVGGQ
jgi:hypothetical protein